MNCSNIIELEILEDETNMDLNVEFQGDIIRLGSGGEFIETDPTVPDWAKQPEKPKYTAEEIGTLTAEQIESAINQIKLTPGPKGDTGEQGPRGEQGLAGDNGQDGLTPTINEEGNWQIGDIDTGVKAVGSDGKSAYEIAKENGFEGAETEWLESLKGIIDLNYNPESENAQSGKAVAEACASTFNYAKEYTDRNKVVVSHEYIPSSGQAMSGIAVTEAVKEAKDYTDENKITVTHKYMSSSSQAISGMGVAEALRTIKGLVDLGTISKFSDFGTINYDMGYIYLFKLMIGGNYVPCHNYGYPNDVIGLLCVGVYSGSNFRFLELNYGHTCELSYATKGFIVTDLPDATLSTSSKNPIQNKVITEAINDINSQLDGLEALLASI